MIRAWALLLLASLAAVLLGFEVVRVACRVAVHLLPYSSLFPALLAFLLAIMLAERASVKIEGHSA